MTWTAHLSPRTLQFWAHLPYLPLLQKGTFQGTADDERDAERIRKIQNKQKHDVRAELNACTPRPFSPGPART